MALLEAAPNLARALPWIGHDDPWAILVSEFMLQQTQVSRVREPWERFLGRFPTPADCAKAPLADVLSAWRGLGFPRRAKYLHQSAQALVDSFDGRVPDRVDQLRSLPGVGEYTANAVASFAFGRPVAVLDTNVGRILARALAGESLSARRARELASELLGDAPSSQFNQAMLDLGAQFCRPRPLCDTCPVAQLCRWRTGGGVDPATRSAGVSRPQGAFVGSLRQARGRVMVAAERGASDEDVRSLVDSLELADAAISSLVADGLIERHGTVWRLAGYVSPPTGNQ